MTIIKRMHRITTANFQSKNSLQRVDQLEMEDKEKQDVLDTGQHHQRPAMQMQVDRHCMSILVEPELLLSIPYADDTDGEDLEEAEEVRIFPADRPSSLHIIGGPSCVDYSAARMAPVVVPSPLGPLYGGHLPASSPSSVPHPDGLPDHLATAPSPPQVPTPGNDQQTDNDVFVDAPAVGGLSETEKMFADMTSPPPRLRRPTSDPTQYKSESDENEPLLLRMTHSFPLDGVKTYSCIKQYQLDETGEINRIINELNLSVCACEASNIAKPKEKHRKNKKQPLQSLTKRLPFLQKFRGKKTPQVKKSSRNDSSLYTFENREDTVDSLPTYGEDEYVILTNGPPGAATSGQDEMERILRQGARSHGLEEESRPGDRSHLDQPARSGASSKWPLHNESLLLLKAPICRRRVTYDFDEQARTKEYESFCKLYPGLVDNSVQKTEETVNTFEEIENCIRKFFREGASHAVMAGIIFNGHGSRKGLTLSRDDPVPLDRYITRVSDLLEEHRANDQCKLPHIVKIVFAQCYGHEYSEPDNHDNVDGNDDSVLIRRSIEIISFTNPDAPKTHSVIKLDPLTLDVLKSEQCELNSYAKHNSLFKEVLEKIRRWNPRVVPIKQHELGAPTRTIQL